MRVEASGLSDVGRSRDQNEDCFAVDTAQRVFVVADGMGGHQHGEVASRLAVDCILENLGRPEEIDEGPASSLPRAIQMSHRRIWRASLGDETLAGMGTTVVALVMTDGQAVIAHVGDSRAYRYRQGTLEQLTRDHSWVGEQVAAGLLSAEQARLHPLKNVITRALGGENGLEVEVGQWAWRDGDLFLLCSDGLTGMLEDAEIAECLSAEQGLEGAGEELVRRANERGGLDNITVVLVRATE